LMMVAALLGTALFVTSGEVQHAEKKYRAAQEKLDATKAAIKILQAEWAYLNRPDRLEELATSYLRLAPQPVPTIARSVALLPDEAEDEAAPTADIPAAAAPKSNPIKQAAYVVKASKPAQIITKAPSKPTPRFDQVLSRLTKKGEQ
jgi:hypothetical protein